MIIVKYLYLLEIFNNNFLIYLMQFYSIYYNLEKIIESNILFLFYILNKNIENLILEKFL